MKKNFSILLLFIFLILVYSNLFSNTVKSHYKILVLHSYHHGYEWTDSIQKGIESTFAKLGKEITVYTEYMDSFKINNAAVERKLAEIYKLKYSFIDFDLIICSDNFALDFLEKYRNDLFPDIPIFFCGINDFTDSMIAGQRAITGVSEDLSVQETLDIALKLHKEVKRIIAYGDGEKTYQLNKGAVLKIVPQYNKKNIKFIFKENLTFDKILKEVSFLDKQSLILILSRLRMKSGEIMPPEQSARHLYKISNVPMYSFWEFFLDNGIVGGKLISGEATGCAVAEMALRFINGEKIENIAVCRQSPNKYMFDFIPMQKFNIKISDLPEGSIVINQPSPFLNVSKKFLISIIITVIVLIIIIFFLILNIIKRHQAEKRLRISEENFRKVFNSNPLMISITNIDDCKFIDINEKFINIIGYKKEEILGKSMIELNCWETLNDRKIFIGILKSAGVVKNFETRLRNNSGEIIDVFLSAELIDYKGKKRILTIINDITELKKIQQNLSTREQLLTKIFETSPVGIIFINNTGKIIFANKRTETILRMPNSEIVNCSYNDAKWKIETLDGNPVSDEETPYKKALKIEQPVYSVILVMEVPKKEKIIISINAAPIKEVSEKLTGVVVTISDITRRFELEKKIKESEVRYRELFDSMSSCVAVYEPTENCKDFIFKDFNYAAEKVEKLKKAELLNRKLTDVFPNVKEFGIIEALQRVCKTGVAEPFPLTLYKDDRITGWRENYIYKLASGEIVAIYDDVTEKKSAEDAIKKLNLELVEKNNELEQLIFVASHDLRSPLVNIQGFSKELIEHFNQIKIMLENIKELVTDRNKLNALLEEEIPESLRYILTSVHKMDSLLAGILKLSRMGRTAMIIKELNMNKLVSDIIKTFEFKIKDMNLNLEINDLPNCKADEIMMIQVFSNLIDNALKYLPDTRPGKIKISGIKKAEEIIYCVEDNGIGIAVEHHQKIFEMFYRLNTSKIKGDGIGLSIIKKTLERHNGKVWVESELDKGSKFFISLPLNR